MSLEKAIDFFRQLSANAFRGGNFLHRRFSQTLYRAELSQQQILPVLAHPRTIIKNALSDALFHEQLMIGVGKPMGFVADALKQAQSAGIHWKLQRQRPARPVNLFVFLRQADDWQIMQPQSLQFTTRGGKLAFPSIDNDQIRQTNEAGCW